LLFDLGQGGAERFGFLAACFGVVHLIFPRLSLLLEYVL
jgi:hypothetical protein